MNQIQTAKQRAAEMKEKIRILSNEIEILRHEISNKDRDLSKKRQENVSAYSQRDAAKTESNRLLSEYRSRRDQIAQQLSRIDSLNTVINSTEQDLVSLKNKFAVAVKDRNLVGMHLLDRNDELCILYEKLNIQIETLDKGQAALADREEEIRKYEIIKNEFNRQVKLLKKLLPQVSERYIELERIQKELSDTRHEMITLSGKMESSNDEERCRYLEGKDPERDVLIQKIKNFEEKLAEKEEKILEKDLILAEITTMTVRLKTQTLGGRQESNETALKLNDLAKRIRTITRSMMGKVSELSMHQATALSLYQQKNEKEALVNEARRRVSAGKIEPWEEADILIKRANIQKQARELSNQIAQDKKRIANLQKQGLMELYF